MNYLPVHLLKWARAGLERGRRAGLLILMVLLAADALAQAKMTAARPLDLQVGGGFSYADTNYNNGTRALGGTFYATGDFLPHFGVELDLHQVNHSSDHLYQRTYEVGARYFRHYGRSSPYAKVLIGRGVQNYPQNVANIAYNLFSAGGGADIAVTTRINIRFDGEYQVWASGYGIPNGLKPIVATAGVAYHFGGGNKVMLAPLR